MSHETPSFDDRYQILDILRDLRDHPYVTYDETGRRVCFYCEVVDCRPYLPFIHADTCIYLRLHTLFTLIDTAQYYREQAEERMREHEALMALLTKAGTYPEGSEERSAAVKLYEQRLQFIQRRYNASRQ